MESVGLRVDEVVDGPGDGQIVLASRGLSFWDYGAIARVIVEPAESDGGSWVRVTSRLKMQTNLAGKSDYREEILADIHEALATSSSGLPTLSMATRVGDPLTVGTRLRIRGVRAVVDEVDGSTVVLEDGLGAAPQRFTRDELTVSGDVERLVREPYRARRLLIGTVAGVALGALLWKALSADGTPYGNTMGAVYGVTTAVSGITVGAVWGNRGRTQWRAMR